VPTRSADRGEEIAARLLAAAANLGAHAAVVMVRRVALAFIPARTTHHDARLDRGPDYTQVDFGLAGHHAADRLADVGAVEAEPDAPDQLRHVRLAEAGIGAARAGGGAIEALVDAAQEQVAIKADGPRVPLDDFSNSHVALLRVVIASRSREPRPVHIGLGSY
jgi:hypothetical protein